MDLTLIYSDTLTYYLTMSAYGMVLGLLWVIMFSWVKW